MEKNKQSHKIFEENAKLTVKVLIKVSLYDLN